MRIAILSIPGVQMLDIVGPADVFSEANVQLGNQRTYEIQVAAASLDTIMASNGMRFSPDFSTTGSLKGFDTLLVSGSRDVHKHVGNRELISWIAKESRHVRRVGSICTGAFLLAHAGLLDGRRATTHWNSTSRLADTFPKINVEPNRIYVKDGPVYTSAGITASMDLALALVEEDHGRSVALRVAKELVLFLKRPGGQSQFSADLATQVSEIGALRDIRDWILGNLNDDLSVEHLAKRLGMSTRNFARMFKREINMTPGDYVEAARVDAARRILEETEAPLKKVASTCGFGDQGGLRRAFMRRINVTPAEYRQRFHPPEPSILRQASSR